MSEVAKPKDAHEVERLHSEIIAWLATTRPDGHPNLAPVWFLWEDPTILIFSHALPHGKSSCVRFKPLFSSDSALVCPPRPQRRSSALER